MVRVKNQDDAKRPGSRWICGDEAISQI